VDADGKRLFSIKPDKAGKRHVLAGGFGREHLALAEVGASFRIFEISTAREVLTYSPPQNHHVLELSALRDGPVFHGVQWNYWSGGPKVLIRLDPNAKTPTVVRQLDEAPEMAFCREGSQLLTSEGELIDCETGDTVRQLRFPQKEYPRK
jgi:hypothetical protein